MTCLTTPTLVGLLVLAAMVGATVGITALALVCAGKDRT